MSTSCCKPRHTLDLLHLPKDILMPNFGLQSLSEGDAQRALSFGQNGRNSSFWHILTIVQIPLSISNSFYSSLSIFLRGVGRGGGAEGAAAPQPPKKKRREGKGREKERKLERRERGIKKESKLNQSFQEHVVMGLWWSPDPLQPQDPTVMVSAFHASCQPPLSQNPAYAPELFNLVP